VSYVGCVCTRWRRDIWRVCLLYEETVCTRPCVTHNIMFLSCDKPCTRLEHHGTQLQCPDLTLDATRAANPPPANLAMLSCTRLDLIKTWALFMMFKAPPCPLASGFLFIRNDTATQQCNSSCRLEPVALLKAQLVGMDRSATLRKAQPGLCCDGQ
jgi:hypothetical protein